MSMAVTNHSPCEFCGRPLARHELSGRTWCGACSTQSLTVTFDNAVRELKRAFDEAQTNAEKAQDELRQANEELSRLRETKETSSDDHIEALKKDLANAREEIKELKDNLSIEAKVSIDFQSQRDRLRKEIEKLNDEVHRWKTICMEKQSNQQQKG